MMEMNERILNDAKSEQPSAAMVNARAKAHLADEERAEEGVHKTDQIDDINGVHVQ